MNIVIRKQFLMLLFLLSTATALAEEGATSNDQKRWSYFGQVSSNGEIIKSNFTPAKEPSTDDMITVTNDISVRVSPPSAGNVMGEKVDALAAGTQVKVVDVLKFPSSKQESLIWVNTAPSN